MTYFFDIDTKKKTFGGNGQQFRSFLQQEEDIPGPVLPYSGKTLPVLRSMDSPKRTPRAKITRRTLNHQGSVPESTVTSSELCPGGG